ncbi:MAG: cupin domain-containing protein [Porticoccaceae bacterium]|jgi:cupin 2 domain-containing protein|nr:cupin domain-containing protein [Porticoccaceae bacterium]MEA3298841.1 cupin domain-containing protein [Pseudomonadota bacterium]HLS97526.1 cupin domain-containing protein [Porticoccaceae bacterium]
MTTNLFANIPAALPDELLETLAEGHNVRVERIVSRGHCTPQGQWYDQDEHEWVLLVSGAATLAIDGEVNLVHLGPGDHILLPAHRRHRVLWTDPATDTVWVAVFFRDP